PPGAYRLIASRPAPTSTSPTYGTAQERAIFAGSDATLVLPGLTRVRGRVVTSSGAPVTRFGVSLAPGRFPPDRALFPPPRQLAADDGRFALDEVPEGSYRLQITGPGIAETIVAEPFEVGGE